MSDADEALWNDVKEEALGEVRCAQSRGLSGSPLLSVLVTERDLAILIGKDAFFADGDSMRVATQVAQDLFRSSHGSLGVDNEFLSRRAPQQEPSFVFGHAQTALHESRLKSLEQLASKHFGKPPDGEEELQTRRDPQSPIKAQSSSGDDAVNVGVIPEQLIPGVENGDQAGSGAKIRPAHIDDRFGGGLEQEGIRRTWVLQEERNQAVRKGEDHMKVGNRKQVVHLRFNPKRLIQALALGTMSIAAGVIGGILAPAVIASLQVPTQGRGATCDQGIDDVSLVVAEVWKIPRMVFEDLSQFRSRRTRTALHAVRHAPTPSPPCFEAGQADSGSG